MNGPTTYVYLIVRAELSGGALIAYALHAGRECVGPPPHPDERSRVLVATKDQMEKLEVELSTAGIAYHSFVETDGELAGSRPFLTFATREPEVLKPLLGHLKPWKAPKAGGWNEAIDACLQVMRNTGAAGFVGSPIWKSMEQLKR